MGDTESTAKLTSVMALVSGLLASGCGGEPSSPTAPSSTTAPMPVPAADQSVWQGSSQIAEIVGPDPCVAEDLSRVGEVRDRSFEMTRSGSSLTLVDAERPDVVYDAVVSGREFLGRDVVTGREDAGTLISQPLLCRSLESFGLIEGRLTEGERFLSARESRVLSTDAGDEVRWIFDLSLARVR